jgi:hypothetical protein
MPTRNPIGLAGKGGRWRGSSPNVPKAKRRQQRPLGLGPSDVPLAAKEEPSLGSHLLTPRHGFIHHGIYVGFGRVIHYKSVVRQLHRGPLEEVSLASFALGRAIWVRAHAAPHFDCTEVTRRARSRLGEDRYRLLSNNCEHFCEWCLQDERRSYQVERLLALPRRLARTCGPVGTWLLTRAAIAFDWPTRLLRPLPSTRSRRRPSSSDYRVTPPPVPPETPLRAASEAGLLPRGTPP